MRRAIITAPVARSLDTEPAFGGINLARVPNATNGTLQAWSTPDGDDPRLAADPQLTVYLTIPDMPKALRMFIFLVRRSDSGTQAVNVFYKRASDLDNTDFVRTWNTNTGDVGNIGPITVKRASNMLASDRFVRADCDLAHDWFGVSDDDLGDTN